MAIEMERLIAAVEVFLEGGYPSESDMETELREALAEAKNENTEKGVHVERFHPTAVVEIMNALYYFQKHHRTNLAAVKTAAVRIHVALKPLYKLEIVHNALAVAMGYNKFESLVIRSRDEDDGVVEVRETPTLNAFKEALVRLDNASEHKRQIRKESHKR